jgi:hypothetical protein
MLVTFNSSDIRFKIGIIISNGEINALPLPNSFMFRLSVSFVCAFVCSCLHASEKRGLRIQIGLQTKFT